MSQVAISLFKLRSSLPQWQKMSLFLVSFIYFLIEELFYFLSTYCFSTEGK